MRKNSMFFKSLVKGLFGGFLLVAIFVVLLGGASQAEAALGTGCGDATGTPTGLTTTVLTDTAKNWRPASRWVGGVATLTGKIGTTPTTVTSASITASTSNSITVSAWIPTLPNDLATFTDRTYRVTANVSACVVGSGAAAKNYSCLQIGDAGFCKGPCSAAAAPAECNKFVGAGDLTVGWATAQCTGTPAVGALPAVDGVCVELPGSASSLNDTPLVESGTALLALVNIVTNWIFAIFVVLSIIFVLLAAFQFVTAGGQAEKVGEARQKLIWAAVGIIIALLSKGLVPVIRAIVGG